MAGLHLLSPGGFRAGGVAAGLKSKGRNDIGLLVADAPAVAAAVFTTNKVFAAPVGVGREHIARGRLRGVVVNSGNANACTGRRGWRDAVRMCQLAARQTGCDPHEFLPSSTGIIGHLLPMAKIQDGILAASQALGTSEEHALAFADAILTTDLKRKAAATRVKIGRQAITVAGVCKGSGMIGPRMAAAHAAPHATMLAYLTTDAAIAASALRTLFAAAADDSFNAVTVDDHASTNDTALILASGASGVTVRPGNDLRKFTAAVREVCRSLAYQIAADGEGATKVVKIVVTGARSAADARLISRAIAVSPLVKCAMHGNDPNWGRIVSAAGLCGAAFDPEKSTLKLQGTAVFRAGSPLKFNAAAVSKSLAARDVLVELACNLGRFSDTMWTCDLSKEYVTINADYHT